MRSCPGQQTVEKFIGSVVSEAMAGVRREFEQLGNEARLVRGEDVALGMATCALRIDIAGQKRFHSLVSPVECAIPAFGGRQVQQGDRYFKVEALSQPASAGHDLMVLN